MTVSAVPLVGRDLNDRDNRPAGKVRAVYRYPAELGLPWGAVAVVTGWLVRSVHLVDLEDAEIAPDVIRVPYTKRAITSAPHFMPVVGDTLAGDHASLVRHHYRG